MSARSDGRHRSLFFEHCLLPEGWARNVRVTLEQGRIAAVDAGAEPSPGDERHPCALPGMPNLHSHAFQRGMAGLAEQRGPANDSFWTWREIMYRFVQRMTPDDVRAIAAMAYVEMLEGGFTRVGEFHYLHHDREGRAFVDVAQMSAAVLAAAGDTGIGMTLLPVLYSYAGFGAQPPAPAQARFVNDLDRYARLLEGAEAHARALPDAVVGVAPHSLRAVSPDQLRDLEPLAKARPVHIHIAEQVKEVDDCLAWSGRRPVEWLLNNAEVDARWCLVHATHMTESETVAAARSGAVAGLCPITEANLGDGLFPVEAFLQAGGRYGIGSDSNVLIDAAEELRLLEYGQRLTRRARNVMARESGRSTGADLYAGALTGGAAALGVEGGIAVGLPADIVSLNLDHPAMVHRAGDAITDSFVFAAGRSAIDCVWRHGDKLVSEGRHHVRDRVVRDYAKVLETLIA
ncbi:formimidoylglutamate deiminase [Novosphingobium resinovorum]|uniref:formimidoylglutamate deiminase n=1 Tax=Novosphingobium TaxID=165696 RepID=UPI001B3C8041|nr:MULTISPECIES: formimidoylglutamate deiminase [Novosphingobium]MBF7014685.1 formimidoylglutamate deiminase [Novosphingobium sp. HR1a]WJM24833.1 formimidoylglutamate deiminase [Novosphingobium resinovorum]